MRNATPALVLSLAVGLLVAEACKKDDDTAPVVADAEAPPPPPVAADAAAPPIEPPPVVPPTPVPVSPTPVRDAGTTTDAGKTDAGATDAGAKPDAATTGGGNPQACFAKCQAALAGCLTPQPGKDGGLPTLGDPTKCNAARDACQAACKP